MNEPLHDQNPTLRPSDLDRIDQLCEQFEDAWKDGHSPKIEECLEQFNEPDRAVLFQQLLPVELHWRRRSGEQPTAEEYAARFTAYTDEIAAMFASTADVDTPRSLDQTIDVGMDQARALHIRCPHCQERIELVDDSPLAELTCPSCGSGFGVVGDEALVFQTDGGTKHRRQSFGHFELVEQLGSGGFGTVWRARDTKLDRIVAVKIPRKGQLDAEETEKFLREARAAAQLRHPNIVSVHEVGLEGDVLYTVSDYIEGPSLQDILTARKYAPREAAELCVKIAEALHFSHENGVIHRDLKPSNIMLDDSGEPHLMDFGLAKREAGEITMTVDGQILGTPAYMSPEQAKGEGHTADRRTDVYSLGVVLFEILTGERPFRGNVRMLVKQVVEDDPPSLRKFGAHIPRDMETICLKCLEKDPNRRYATAGGVMDELRRFVHGEPIRARPIGRITRVWRFVRRYPAISSLAAAVVVVLMIGIASTSYWAWWYRQAEQRAEAKADEAVESLVTALMSARPEVVLQSLDALRPFREQALPVLRDQFQRAAGDEKLHAAYGLAALGESPSEYLVERIADIRESEGGNLLNSLLHNKTQNAELAIEHFDRLPADKAAERRSRLALMAINLGNPQAAEVMLSSAPIPNERTAFIDNFTAWRGDLCALKPLLADCEDPLVCSGITLALGNVPPDDASARERETLIPILVDWYRSARDGGMHSAASWTLRQWNVKLPQIKSDASPRDDRSWYVNSLGMTMLRIRGASFSRNDAGPDRMKVAEKRPEQLAALPSQQVVITRDFYLADCEVTIRQFRELVKETEKPPPRDSSAQDSSAQLLPAQDLPTQLSNSNQWSNRSQLGHSSRIAEDPSMPKHQLTKVKAALFCNRLSELEGSRPVYLIPSAESGESFGEEWFDLDADGYRLPTEAEWESAGRSGTTTSYFFGDQDDSLSQYAAIRGLLPVASRMPNPWGLFDMHGNVAEWCNDVYGPYGSEPVKDPTGPAVGSLSVVRGGTCRDASGLLRFEARDSLEAASQGRYVGFRVARNCPRDGGSAGASPSQ